ncbi:MAG: caspase family protein [Prevotella sp.]|nr:caspase family protein [Prevotella sp.]
MKKFLLSAFFLGISTLLHAQSTLIDICGSSFRAELDNVHMTAELVDYSHEIDDNPLPMKIETRKFKKLYGNMLEIPSTISAYGKEYTVTSIGRGVFADYTNFSYVNIPETVKTIGDYAFFRTKLLEINIPSSVVSIGDRAFGLCKKLSYINLPQGVSLGSDVYEASVIVKYSAGSDMANSNKSKPQQKPENVTSDIDMNIPTTSLESAPYTFAIIIANENYMNEANVDYAIQDGRTFRNYCQQVLGLPQENIRFQEDATLNNMKTMVNWISNVAKAYKGKAQILFYYAGHGIPDDNGNTSLLPVDGSAKDLSTGYSLKSLYSSLGSLSANSVCVFLDACFSGKQRNDELLVAARGVRKAKEEMPSGNMIVFSAAKDDETAHSYPEKGHGLFTYFLIKKIKETKGNVTLGELSDYINENVSQKSIVVLNTVQTPTTNASASMKSSWRDMKLK